MRAQTTFLEKLYDLPVTYKNVSTFLRVSEQLITATQSPTALQHIKS